MALLDKIPFELGEDVLRRLPASSRTVLLTCCRTVAGVPCGSFVRNLLLYLDGRNILDHPLRAQRLLEMVSVERLVLVGRGDAGHETTDELHILLETTFILNRHVPSMPKLVYVELSGVPLEAVLVAAECLTRVCPTVASVCLTDIRFRTSRAVDTMASLFNGLTSLELHGCHLPDAVSFGRLTGLRSLRLVDNFPEQSGRPVAVSLCALPGIDEVRGVRLVASISVSGDVVEEAKLIV